MSTFSSSSIAILSLAVSGGSTLYWALIKFLSLCSWILKASSTIFRTFSLICCNLLTSSFKYHNTFTLHNIDAFYALVLVVLVVDWAKAIQCSFNVASWFVHAMLPWLYLLFLVIFRMKLHAIRAQRLQTIKVKAIVCDFLVRMLEALQAWSVWTLHQ